MKCKAALLFWILFSLGFFVSRTLSINFINTQDTSSDVVDEEQTTDPNIDPTLSMAAI
jgi:hypothetical protein